MFPLTLSVSRASTATGAGGVRSGSGLPAFDLVGLPDAAVKEAKERVRSAIRNAGFRFPVSRITVNLSPADRKKEGTVYDLPILLGILKASGGWTPSCPAVALWGRSA